MLAYRFEAKVPESGLVRIPQEILEKIKDRIVEVVIIEEDASRERKTEDVIQRLRGKYKGYLSTTEEFSKRKALEKEKEL